MDNAIFGIIGATLGVSGTLATVLLTHHFTKKREEEKFNREQSLEKEAWLREQKRACYHNAVKYLHRVCAIGAYARKTATIRLPDDAPTAWFDDIAEANSWLASLHYYCGDDYYDEIGDASTEFLNLSRWLIGFRPSGRISREHFADLLSPEGDLDFQNFVDLINQIENVISNCARREFQLGPRPERDY
jgi:hypothetical protein